jgi:glycosyltransferase involved in cell wall biosynthesis
MRTIPSQRSFGQMKKSKLLVVGTSPPPLGGQALMIQALLSAPFEKLELYHVRMSFSDTMASMGKVSLKKIAHVCEVIARVIMVRIWYGVPHLYYVPGGSSAAPVIRDLIILNAIKPLFRRRVYHFHAAGICQVIESLPQWIRSIAVKTYSHASVAIHLSARNPDVNYFPARLVRVIHNGLEDMGKDFVRTAGNGRTINLLFVGVIQYSKGVSHLVETLDLLIRRGVDAQLWILGEYASIDFKVQLARRCAAPNLAGRVHVEGVKAGNEKWDYYRRCDIFCFPSFFESESFGNVIVEAMMFSMPVVATAWRGIPDVVQHGVTGLLVPPRDSTLLADAIQTLTNDKSLRLSMGIQGRKVYLEKFRIDRFFGEMEACILDGLK